MSRYLLIFEDGTLGEKSDVTRDDVEMVEAGVLDIVKARYGQAANGDLTLLPGFLRLDSYDAENEELIWKVVENAPAYEEVSDPFPPK